MNSYKNLNCSEIDDLLLNEILNSPSGFKIPDLIQKGGNINQEIYHDSMYVTPVCC
jgi:hypothetical protein